MNASQADAYNPPRSGVCGIAYVILWLLTLSSLPIAMLLDCASMWLMFLALGLAVIVWIRPEEAAGAGMLFLLAASIVLPYAARFLEFSTDTTEMYYWAAGLFIITAAAIARLGMGQMFTIPLAARTFLAIASLAAVYGLACGVAPSYVLRQYYGVLLLIIYFGIAMKVGSEELLLLRIRTFGVACALMFFAYYIAVFSKYGFHKEMGSTGTQASLLAAMLFMAGRERKKRSWILGAITLLFVPILIFMRRDVLTFLMAVVMASAMRATSNMHKRIYYGAIVLIMSVALVTPIAQLLNDQLVRIHFLGAIVPEGVQDANTLYERTLQLVAALGTVQQHPLFGSGMGGDIQWERPSFGLEQVAYVDNGWAYLLQKVGLLGAAAFFWFLITVLRGVSRKAPSLSACLLAATFVTMFSEPVYFHFTTAPYIGTFAGLLLSRRYSPRAPEERFTLARAGSV
jgi:O-antigen ligase